MTGVFYGIYHRRTLQKAHDQKKEHHAIHQRQNLIAEAKEAWRKKQEGGKDGGECLLCYITCSEFGAEGILKYRFGISLGRPTQSP